MSQITTGQFSHPGRRRSNNEDWLGSFEPEDAERLAAKGRLFLVADGMGGHESGELASRRAVDLVIRNYMDDTNADVRASLGGAIRAANVVLCEGGSKVEGARRWGTTLVAAVIRQDQLWIANVGDSRAYLLRGGDLRQLSRDHSWASADPASALPGNWIGRNVITRALGLKPDLDVDLFPPIKLRVGDTVLLCSDGLTVPLTSHEIAHLARRHPPQRAAEALVQAANDQGGPDNVSVMLIHIAAGSLGRLPVALCQALRLGDRNLSSPTLLLLLLLVALAAIGLGFFLGLVLF
jgi:serine/threonine protein phosphatase PrpC